MSELESSSNTEEEDEDGKGKGKGKKGRKPKSGEGRTTITSLMMGKGSIGQTASRWRRTCWCMGMLYFKSTMLRKEFQLSHNCLLLMILHK